MTRNWQPKHCAVCRMHNSGAAKLTTLMRNLDDLNRIEFMCGFCGSIFWWNKDTREACGLESRYAMTRAGWDKHITHIDPKWEKGDECPRCKEENFKETFGKTGKCVICDGTKIYPGE